MKRSKVINIHFLRGKDGWTLRRIISQNFHSNIWIFLRPKEDRLQQLTEWLISCYETDSMTAPWYTCCFRKSIMFCVMTLQNKTLTFTIHNKKSWVVTFDLKWPHQLLPMDSWLNTVLWNFSWPPAVNFPKSYLTGTKLLIRLVSTLQNWNSFIRIVIRLRVRRPRDRASIP